MNLHFHLVLLVHQNLLRGDLHKYQHFYPVQFKQEMTLGSHVQVVSFVSWKTVPAVPNLSFGMVYVHQSLRCVHK